MMSWVAGWVGFEAEAVAERLEGCQQVGRFSGRSLANTYGVGRHNTVVVDPHEAYGNRQLGG